MQSRFVADFTTSVEYSDEQTERAAYQWLVVAIGTVAVLISRNHCPDIPGATVDTVVHTTVILQKTAIDYHTG